MTKTVDRILALDPGGTTGWATCKLSLAFDKSGSPLSGPGTKDEAYVLKFKWGEFKGDVTKQAWLIGRKVAKKRCRIVIHESSDHFLLQGHRRAMRKHSLIPIELAGAVKAVISILNHQKKSAGDQRPEWFTAIRVEQTPSQAKSVITDHILKSYGFPVKHMSTHERDACRHLLLFLRRVYASAGNTRAGAESFASYIASALEA